MRIFASVRISHHISSADSWWLLQLFPRIRGSSWLLNIWRTQQTDKWSMLLQIIYQNRKNVYIIFPFFITEPSIFQHQRFCMPFSNFYLFICLFFEIWVVTKRLRARIKGTDICRVACPWRWDKTLCHSERTSHWEEPAEVFQTSGEDASWEVFQAWPTGMRPQSRPRKHWGDYIFQLAWERLSILPEELWRWLGRGSLCLGCFPQQPQPMETEINGWVVRELKHRKKNTSYIFCRCCSYFKIFKNSSSMNTWLVNMENKLSNTAVVTLVKGGHERSDRWCTRREKRRDRERRRNSQHAITLFLITV